MPANRIKLEPALVRRYAKQAKKHKLRQIVCKILVVCEGTKTEPNYFEAFRTFNRGTSIYDIEVKGLGSNTINVVDKAIELKNKGSTTVCGQFSTRTLFPTTSSTMQSSRQKTMVYAVRGATRHLNYGTCIILKIALQG